MTTYTHTTPAGAKVRLRVAPVGVSFGFAAVLSSRNGRRIGETDAYHTREAALLAGERLADRLSEVRR